MSESSDLMLLQKAGSIDEITGTVSLLREGGFRPEGQHMELTLDEAINIALSLNPQIQSSMHGVAGAVADLDLVLSDYRDKYSLDGSMREQLRRITGSTGFRIDPDLGVVRENVTRYENGELFTLGPTYSRQFRNGAFLEVAPSLEWEHRSDAAFDSGGDNDSGHNEEDRYRIDLRFDLPINSRPREQIETRIENARISTVRSDYQLYMQKQQIVEQIINQYWNIKLLQEELDIQNERLLQARRIEFIIQTQYEFENASEVQVGQAQIDVLNNQASLINTEGNLRTANEIFNLVLGIPITTELTLVDPLEVSPLPMSASEYISMITSSNLTLRNIELAIEQAENNLRVARLGQQPNLSWTNSFFRTDEGVQTYTTALVFSWPFGDGGATRARVRGLEESLEQLKIDLWDQERRLVQETYGDLRDLQIQMQRIPILERNVEQAYVNLENDLFIFTETGRITFRDMQDSQIDLAQSRINLARAIASYNFAKASLLQKVHNYEPSDAFEPALGLLK
ncbi:MAG: TolC family protein [bacterium]